ncbi:MAG: CoA transferase [Dehalococcoidia bacterium]|nr:CoA transferase [Dehalococcoidia bacterium]
MAEQALGNLKVINLSHLFAGPYSTHLPAGFGVSVVKVEKPPDGDLARRIDPFQDDVPGAERSLLFLCLNSSKKSVTLNLKTTAGRKIMRELLKFAAMLVESFKLGFVQC